MDNWQEIPKSDTVEKDNNKELMQFVNKLIAKWYWFLLSAFIGLVLAFLFIRYQTPVFKIHAKILVNDETKGGALAAQSELLDLGGLLGGKSSVDNEAEVLKTRFLMQQVVEEINANVKYYYHGRIRTVELYKSPFIVNLLNVRDSIENTTFELTLLKSGEIELQNGDYSKIVKFDVPFILEDIGKVSIKRNIGYPFDHDKYSFAITSVDKQVSELMRDLEIGVTNKQVSTIDLVLNHPIPKRGEDLLNVLIQKYVAGNLIDKNRIADSTISFIEERLMLVGEELGSIEGNIQRFRQDSRVTDIEAQSKLLIENSSEYFEELAKIETQLTILNSLDKYLKDDSKNKRVLPSSILPGDMVFNGLIERYNSLLLERDRQSLSSTETNPYIQNLDQQISNLRKDMLSNLVNTRSSLSISRDELKRRTGRLEGEIRRVPSTQRAYLDMARQQQIKQELYIYLLQKREETAISKTSNISNSKIIDPPKADPKPISPKKAVILLIGVVLGLLIPFLVIYLKDLLNTKIFTKEDIQTKVDVPIIAEISNSNSPEIIVVGQDTRTAIAEQFRALRTNLHFFLKPDEKTILLTSSMSGEGKSFVALNIANVLAISGKKVVVMEMDLRKPNLSNKLNISNTLGFTNYIISEDIKFSEIVKKTNVNDNLYIVSSGPIPPNPAETILNSKTENLFAYLADNFDYIIIDAPPIGLVTDAQLLSKYSALTLYLVRQGYTHKEQLNILKDLHKNKKMNKLAILVNDIKIEGGYGYGYGYGYGGSYGYGNYGSDISKPNSKWFKRS